MDVAENPWKTFFDQHAPDYMNEVFTRNTEEEIQFLIEEFSLPAGSHILDVGCGTGRHAIGLAKNGYRVTGVDISSGMLAEAAKAAAESGVQIDWVQCDAAVMKLNTQADAAICLCEGSFGLIGSSDEVMTHERKILESIHRSAKPGAKLILTAPNGLAKIRAATDEQVRSGEFDPLTLTESITMRIDSQHGPQELGVYERGFVPSELRLLLELTGYEVHAIYGGTAGSWNRELVALDEIEIMVIAVRR
jgi:SAM-dependent methyltransferase